MKKGKNIIIGINFGEIIATLACFGLIFFAYHLFGVKSVWFWVILVFFGIGIVGVLWKYLNPKNKFVGINSKEAKQIRKEKFDEIYNTNGLFEYNDLGFNLLVEGKQIDINWNEINKLTAYKLDLLTTDEICLFVQAENGKQFQITESTKGWFQFTKKVKEKFPNISENWEVEIANPAFERKETELYDRNKKVV